MLELLVADEVSGIFAHRTSKPLASSAQMAEALWLLMVQYGQAGAGDRMNKCLADFDLRSLRRLERGRLMVRFGPALGLMGTLIPLSPALAGLAEGNVDALAVAFLLAALQSVNLSDLLTKSNVTLLRTQAGQQTLIVKDGDKIETVRLGKKTVTGTGKAVGQVYRLADGRLVYVQAKKP